MNFKYVFKIMIIMLVGFTIGVRSFKCYQCRSDKQKGCDSKKLQRKYLLDCKKPLDENDKEKVSPSSSKAKIFCRKTEQNLFLKFPSEYTIIRECAFIEKLECKKLAWKDMTITTCECSKEGCNRANISLRLNWTGRILKVVYFYLLYVIF